MVVVVSYVGSSQNVFNNYHKTKSNSDCHVCEHNNQCHDTEQGHVELAISKPKGAGCETPTSEPGFSITDQVL